MAGRRSAPEINGSADLSPEMVKTSLLHLDSKNPRLQQAGHDADESEVLEILWREYSVDEVAMSIAENGFFPHEPLFVTEEDSRLVVIEGNRRLAAVRLLCDPDLREQLRATGLPKIAEREADELRTLPVIRCQRQDVWQYVGFKHVNGPQVWNSLAKAEYIAWVRNDLKTDLRDIAQTIGDRHQTVARLYRAYMALKQAEANEVYHREWRVRKHFSFSHLYTGLDYPGIREFTGIAPVEPPKERPVPKTKLQQFGELCVWLWGDHTRTKAPVVRSQNPDLRRLDEALLSRDGLAALRANFDLDTAVSISRGDTVLFRESLVTAKKALQDARGKVVTGFEGEQDLLDDSEQIVDIARALKDDMVKLSQRPRRRSRSRRRS